MKNLSSRRCLALWRGVSACFLLGFCLQSAQAGELQSIRDEVRDPADRSFSLSWGKGGDTSDTYDNGDDGFCLSSEEGDLGYSLLKLGGVVTFYTVTSPFSLPRLALGDDGQIGYFPKFPYRKGDSFLMFDNGHQQPRRYAGRVRMEYGENFQDLQRLGGQFQIETAARFGIDTEAHRFEEQLGGDRQDYLWLGDYNFTYRFAQSERAAWRAGLGVNWLDDPIKTDYGFNFTYGFDLYPRRPWVFSTALDVGTLGKSELFRFRTTAGVMVHRIETYVGYEYLNVAHTTYNGLIAGVGIYF